MIDEFYQLEPYGLVKEEKSKLLTKELLELTERHQKRCIPYANIIKGLKYRKENVYSPSDIPFFPVRLFKKMDLLSIDHTDIFKIMTSSGTTGQAVSKIFVDKETAMIQQKVLVRILGDYLGKQRIPMLIIDTPAVTKDRKQFTARGAAIIGLQIMAKEMVYALKEDMSFDYVAVEEFLEKQQGKKFLIFGFTFLVWKHLYEEFQRSGKKIDLSNGLLMTGGGWKKLSDSAISQEEFQKRITEAFKIHHFLDHYAMVEQTGCIYAECEYHHLHASIYSDVFIRDPEDFSLCNIGEEGIIQTVSVLPHSYPGHSLLTEDIGVILGEDDCPCKRKGKYIKILGRMKSADLRGCSDAYAAEHGTD